jgi:hypothetical protein
VTAEDREWSLLAFKMETTIASPHFNGKEPSLQIQLYIFSKNKKVEGGRCLSTLF